MKTNAKNTLTLEKFQIAKLTNLKSIIGGKANNTNNTQEEENEESPSTTTDTWTTITRDGNTFGG
ncbi:hypothetical protein [uncultured Dokdonia sp.]|uniref:hypothetical protein n=1 Tax=uncultured Dokdonia sp. TaxID=575653 RepID=UPI00260CF7A7|nr:hypothetical protein [uncultured Dokdonia sp.]